MKLLIELNDGDTFECPYDASARLQYKRELLVDELAAFVKDKSTQATAKKLLLNMELIIKIAKLCEEMDKVRDIEEDFKTIKAKYL